MILAAFARAAEYREIAPVTLTIDQAFRERSSGWDVVASLIDGTREGAHQMWNGRTVSVVLGTYAERDSIREVVDGFFATSLVDEVVVVNNNAEAGTAEEVAKTRARQVFEPNQGYGYAYRRGLAEATGDLLILAEPDGTFLPRDVIKLLAYSDDCDAVLGTRTTRELIWRGANMGTFLKWGNWAVAKLVEFLFNTSHLSDVGCTYRLLTRELLERIQPRFSVGGSHFGPELMLLVITSGARFVEVPVNYLPRVGKSSVTGDFSKAVRLGLQMIIYILQFRIRTAITVRAGSHSGNMGKRSSGADVKVTAESPVPRSPGRQTDFDAIADAYDQSLPNHVSEHYLRKRVAFIRKKVPVGASILDVGSGTGVLAEQLLLNGYNVTGADPYAAMLKRMTARNSKINAVQALGRHLPFDDATFDFTYCIAVMHHIANPKDVCETLWEMCRVTKPGGLVLIWDHNPRNPYWPLLMSRVPQDTGAERLIPQDELIGGLVAAGATPIDVRTLGLMPDFVPKPLIRGFAALERVLEITPGLNRYCAHNVVLARRMLHQVQRLNEEYYSAEALAAPGGSLEMTRERL